MKSLLFTGLAAATVLSGTASADIQPGDTLTVSRLGTTPGRAIRYNYDFTRSWDQTPTGANYFGQAGINTFAVDTGGAFRSFCVEMNEGFPDDPIVYTVTEFQDVPEEQVNPGLTMAQQTLMKDLYARFYDVATDYPGTAFQEACDNAAAFQLLVWEISHENFTSDTDAGIALTEMNINLGAMAFTDTYSSDVADIAQAMINDMGDGGFMNYYKLFGLTNPSNQDMLIVVPSPAIAGLAGLGLVGMRRRRR